MRPGSRSSRRRLTSSTVTSEVAHRRRGRAGRTSDPRRAARPEMSAANVARIGVYAAVAALLLPSGAAGQQRAPTLEEFLAAPFAADLVAGPSGQIAWVENVLGARNVYVAEPPAYRARQVTRHTTDDGQRF